MEQKKISQSKISSANVSNIAVAYLRVSSIDQSGNGSLGSQFDSVTEYAKAHELKLEKIFKEVKPASKVKGIDITEDNLLESLNVRPELKEIMTLAAENRFKHLIVPSRDRFARNLEEYLLLRLFLNNYKITLHYSKSGEESGANDDKTARLIDIVLASISELEANTIASRVNDGCTTNTQNGFWNGGKAPLGYIKCKIGKKTKLFKSNHDSSLVMQIFKYYTNGYGYRKIAELMNEHYPYIGWNKSKIEAIIKNETYSGYLTWSRRGGRRNKGKHSTHISSSLIDDICIVEECDWNDSISLRELKSKLKDSKYFSTPFLLKNKLVCNKCNTFLECKNNGKNKKSVYRCKTKEKCENDNVVKSELIINKNDIEALFLKKLKYLFEFKLYDDMWNQYKIEAEGKRVADSENIKAIKNEIDKITTTQKNIDTLLNQDIEEGIKNLIKSKKIYYSKLKTLLNKQLKDLKVKCYCDNKEIFIKGVEKFPGNFTILDNVTQRIIVESFVDKIIVDKTEGQTSIVELIFKPPKSL